MKSLIFAIMMVVASQGVAAASKNYNEDQTTGIITPDVATGYIRYTQINFTGNGIMIVCPVYTNRNLTFHWGVDTCTNDKTQENGFVLPQHAIPAGKTYVGFRSGSAGTTKYIEVYWK